MDIDALFKTPKLPPGSNKRKLPDNPTPEMLKRMKLDVEAQPSERVLFAPPIATRSRAVTVEDADDEEMPHTFGADMDADYLVEEDEEGRFYGGGLTSEQKDILNIFDKDQKEGVLEEMEELSITGIRKLLLRFERALNKNQDQRSKHPDDPAKFIDSEADLDASIKALVPLSQVPTLAYPELVKSGTVTSFVGLLSHENVDIVIDVVETIHEWTDEDVGNEGDDEDEDEGGREQALQLLIEAYLKNSVLELLVDNLPRFNETEESDRQGVFHVLGIFENFIGFDPKLSSDLVKKTSLMPWLLTRMQAQQFDENRGYSAELLSILLQENRENKLAFGKNDGVETVLKILSQYRRRDPLDADELEFMENTFDILCSAVSEQEIKKLLLDAEGIDLMVLIMKDKKQARSRSIKLLDHSLSGPSGVTCCEIFVEALGLKTLFSAFMGKTSGKKVKLETASEDTSHTLGILSSLCTNLASDSPARIRLLAKFVDGGYEKVDKLLEIRGAAEARLKTVDAQIAEEKAEGEEGDDQDLVYLRRLDGGLYTLQTVDYILAWIVMEDDGIRTHAQSMLKRRGKGFSDLVSVLKVYQENVTDSTPIEAGQLPQSEILQHLIGFLSQI